jgi:uncharacterized protein
MSGDSEIVQVVQDDSADPPIRGFVHVPAKGSGEGLILTHGAGANCRSALLTGLAEQFCAAGLIVLRCDLPFRQARAFGPPLRTAERDQQGLKRAVEWMRARSSGRVFLGGHSYGGRQASMLAASEPELAEGLLLLSYPLHPPKKAEQVRTAHFPSLRTPALFVSGMKDEFGTVEELTAALGMIPARTELVMIEGAPHSLLPKRNAEAMLEKIAATFREFFA